MGETSKTENQNITAKRDKYYFFNTLAGLVKSLQGQYTTIDLRNESCVTGKIVFVDGLMNIEIEDAIFFDSRGKEYIFPNFFVSQRNIRYVHIPKRMSSLALIEKQLTTMVSRKTKKRHTYKKVRSKRYNDETISSAFSKES